jgi:SpoVK/Ycf46/Vps4 family AAA+-type ATPase
MQAAGSLATDFKKKLIRVDLTQYIGETEKNLSELFQRAEHEDWILFFDEADALFGKRTEVKDSHDRYANVEVSHLLRRMEKYQGLVILSTNQTTNIDRSVLKKMSHVLKFSP